ncbi:helix-turn-helix domain-containing protein [Sphingomonas sp. I4]
MGLLDHIVRLGCQNALQRVSHLLLELHQRLSAIGFVHAGTFPMPLTQDTLAELLGLSLVHINRIVSQLRREKLVTMRSGIVMIADFPGWRCWRTVPIRPATPRGLTWAAHWRPASGR